LPDQKEDDEDSILGSAPKMPLPALAAQAAEAAAVYGQGSAPNARAPTKGNASAAALQPSAATSATGGKKGRKKK